MAVEFGKYELLQKIGSGGMGQVFLARTVGTQDFEKLLVIKRLLPHLTEDPDFLSMFLDEARIAARLNHPNLIQIFELGAYGDSAYLAMEYVAGEDLRRMERFLRAQSKPLPLGLCCRIIADAAAGLDYAHKARDAQGRPLNLIHRDVSPQNILVGFDGVVKLIDFGVAKAAGKVQHTASGILKGKYPYMSPEQAVGSELDPRSDLFSLGIIFWELLTGKRLFKGESDLTTMRLVAACQVPSPSKLGARAAVDPLVMKALARKPTDRYSDAAAFRLAIEEFILENRLQASAAHLESFMQDLYKERIAQLADPASLDQLSGPIDYDPGAGPSSSFRLGEALLESRENSGSHSLSGSAGSQSGARSQAGGRSQAGRTPSGVRFPQAPTRDERGTRTPSRSKAKRAQTPPPSPPPRSEGTQAMTAAPPQPKGDGRRLVVAGLIGVVCAALVAVGIALWMARQQFPIKPVPAVRTTPPPVTAKPPPAVPPVLENRAPPKPPPAVMLTLTSEPAGATVKVGDKELGITPLEYPLPKDADPVVAVFSLPGYEPREATVSAKDAPMLSVQLTRRKPKPPPRNLGIKTGR